MSEPTVRPSPLRNIFDRVVTKKSRSGLSKIRVRLTSICQIDRSQSYPSPRSSGRSGSGMRFSHLRKTRSICTGSSESEIS